MREKSDIPIEYDEKEIKVTLDLTEFSLQLSAYFSSRRRQQVFNVITDILEKYECTGILQDETDPVKTYITFVSLEELFRFKLEYGEKIVA
jgi:hypothetical protein